MDNNNQKQQQHDDSDPDNKESTNSGGNDDTHTAPFYLNGKIQYVLDWILPYLSSLGFPLG